MDANPNTTEPAEIDTLRIDLPAEWVEFPTTPGEVDDFLATHAQTDRMAGLSPSERRQYENLVRRLVNDLELERWTPREGTRFLGESCDETGAACAGTLVCRVSGNAPTPHCVPAAS